MQSLKKIHAWAQIKVPLFTIFVRSATVKFPSKIAINCGETLLLMSGMNNLAKKYFLSTI